jgi:hypothetical protein
VSLELATPLGVRSSRDINSNLGELVARIHAIVRRSKGHAESVIRTGDLVIKLDTKTVEMNGSPVHLTPKEYQILELLSLRKGTILTKAIPRNKRFMLGRRGSAAR